MSTSRMALLGLALLAATPACYRTTVRSGRPPAATPAPGHDSRWRSSVAFDLFEVDKPPPLDLLCKETGWAEIHQWRSPANWAAEFFLAASVVGFFYKSSKVTVKCAAGPGVQTVVVPVQPGQTVIVQPPPASAPAPAAPPPAPAP